MRFDGLISFTVVSLVAAAGMLTAGDDEAMQKDRKLMAGTWRVLSIERDGKKTTAEQLLDNTRSIISADGSAMVQREGKTIIQGNFKIDPTKKPKRSEATYTLAELKGKTVRTT